MTTTGPHPCLAAPTSPALAPTPPTPSPALPGRAALSVWPVGQRSPAAQRRGRFVPGSAAHPARMWPDLAARIIAEYSRPGDLVLDPLCGIGTTLVEAVHAGRDAIGVECEQRWATLATANTALARAQGGTGHAAVHRGDATTLDQVLTASLMGRVDLVVTSPPYGKTMHGRVEHRRGPLRRFHDTYTPEEPSSPDPQDITGTSTGAGSGEGRPVNLARRTRLGLAEGITAVLTGCAPFLKPGGLVVITARPWRRKGYLVDLPGTVHTAALAAGLRPVERCVALLASVHADHLTPRHSFFQLVHTRRTRAAGLPAHLIAHEEVLVYQTQLPGESP